MATLSETIRTIQDTILDIRCDVSELDKEVELVDKNTLNRLKQLQMTVDRINETVQQMLGQKRQFDTLLGRWAREIDDCDLKQDVMRYVFGDISCEEVLESDTVPSVVFESPEAPLMRTPTCPPAPKKARLETVVE